MAEDNTTRTDTDAQDAKPARRRTTKFKKGDTVKVTGLVNTMYLLAGDEVTVGVTEQLLNLAERGYLRLEHVDTDG